MELLKRDILRITLILIFSLIAAFNITTAQVIVVNSNPSSVTTFYGEATSSTSTTFIVSGTGLSTDITVTPPAAFEVSLDNNTFANTITIPVGGVGVISPTTIYIRLKATTPADTHSGNIILTSFGAPNVNVPMPNSTVTRAPISIRIYAEIDYGDVLSDMTLTSSNFDFSLVNAGLKNGELATALDIRLTGGHTGRDPVGIYNGVIISSNLRGNSGFIANNYAINYISGPITIYPAPLVITTNNATKPYGSTLTGGPASTEFSVSGLLNNETVSTVTITYGNGSAASAPVGTYNGSVVPSAPVGINGFVVSNYAISYQSASIIVNPIPLLVIADNKSKLYGDPIPTLTITYTGFVNGDTPLQLTAQPIIITNAMQSSDVGDYPITVSGGAVPNYTLTYVNGRLTVYKDIIIPNTFTPNGDGINDTWSIINLNPNLTVTVEIMNRYGARVYHSNSNPVLWDGYSNGVPVPFGVYYYVIKGAKENPLTGYVTVVR